MIDYVAEKLSSLCATHPLGSPKCRGEPGKRKRTECTSKAPPKLEGIPGTLETLLNPYGLVERPSDKMLRGQGGRAEGNVPVGVTSLD